MLQNILVNFQKIKKEYNFGSMKNELFCKMVEKEFGVECIPEYKFHPTRKWRFDYAIPKSLIACEVEGGVWSGGRHTSGAGYTKDMEKYSEAAILGWCVIRVTPTNLLKSTTFEMIERALNNRSK